MIINNSVSNDFGNGFIFSKDTFSATEEDLEKYKSGDASEIEKYQYGVHKYDVCKYVVYTGGVYPKVVRLIKDVPTFDSGDREYDSWHDLYLVQKKRGNVFAVYCKGGYRISEIIGYSKVFIYPSWLKRFF